MAIEDTVKSPTEGKELKYKSEIMETTSKKDKKRKRKLHGEIDTDSVKKHKIKKRPKSQEKESEEPITKSVKLSDSDQLTEGSSKHHNKRMRKRKDKFKDKVPDFLRLLQTKPKRIEEEPTILPKTPEEIEQEKMKAEKRERMRKKRIEKKQNKGKKIESTVAKDAALQYLTLWKTHRQIWKFQKVRQVWLLGHMYETDLISDTNFEVLLRYIEDLKGHSRDKTIEQAEKILVVAEEQEEKKDEEGDSEDSGQENGEEEAKKEKSDITSSEKYQRARQVLQILA